MASATERTFLTTLLALEADEAPIDLLTSAVRSLMTVTRARYTRAEVRSLGDCAPLVLVEPIAPDVAESGSPMSRADIVRRSCNTGFATAHLELRSRRAGVLLTFRERELIELLFRAMERLARRTPSAASGARKLHEATREFQEQLVADALLRSHGNVTNAARELGVTRAFVYKCVRTATAKKAS